jgi:periplasmic divalent cation tolerance protein
MSLHNFVELVLSCGSWQEAQKITDSLLEKKLVACVEFFETKSKYWWQGELESANEIKMIMHSAEHLCSAVEDEVKKLHSYDTFVLQAIPVSYVSQDALHWLQEQLSHDK